MREIKFRAWDKVEKQMLNSSTPYDELPFEIYLNGTFLGLPSDSHRDWNDNYILMQFTGLKDKNEKEIYEGDIVCGEHELEFACVFCHKADRFRYLVYKQCHAKVPYIHDLNV